MRRSALYDFSVSPFSYDFLAFICMARVMGCNHTVFVPGVREYQKCSPEEQKFRLENLLVPLAKMSGEVTVCKTREEAKEYSPTFPVGYTVQKPVQAHMFGQLIRSGRARWLKPSEEALKTAEKILGGRSPVTITIRESKIKPLRNSRIGEWVKVAEWLKSEGLDPLFIPDTDNLQGHEGFDSCVEAALNPDVRMAIYSKAYLNLGIGNGPMGLCIYQKYPYLIFRFQNEGFKEQSREFLTANGLPPGSQFPWANNNQRVVWEDDTAENIIKQIELYKLRRAA